VPWELRLDIRIAATVPVAVKLLGEEHVDGLLSLSLILRLAFPEAMRQFRIGPSHQIRGNTVRDSTGQALFTDNVEVA
jgi:hypothetical protein